VRVRSATAGARLAIDGEPNGEVPWEGELDPGHYVFTVGLEGYRTQEREIEVVAGEELELDFDLIRRGELDIGLFTLGLGVQVPFFMINDSAQAWSSAGGSFLLRPLFCLVKRPILFDLGAELAVGYMSSPSILEWEHNGLAFRLDDEAFKRGRLFQLGLYLGFGVPLVVRARPMLYLTASFSTGMSVAPVTYYLNATLGLSYFASDRVELRFELLGVHLRRIYGEAAYKSQVDEENETEVSLWTLHLMPTFAIHIRF